jgi:lysophospholipase L1-like esterase
MLRLRRVLLPAALLALGLAPPAVQASPGSGPATVVTLGDSYISGEAGRWEGNSQDPSPGNSGTDRACLPAGSPVCRVDQSRVYVGGTDANGCHRSDVAPLLSADLPGAERVNLACSGAKTGGIFRASSGGTATHGEAPQADQLLPVAREKDVRLILMSVGGNDLGFASIVTACFEAYLAKTGSCKPSQQQRIDEGLAKATADVEKAIDEVRAVMAGAGYGTADYRLVLQTYPSVVPRAAEARFAEADQRRADGCPFYDADLDWARDSAARQIGAMVRRAAEARGTEVLEIGDLFQGHEFCSTTSRQSTPAARPDEAEAEWGRFLGPSSIGQGGGETQELFHPNAFGQRAMGACLTWLYAERAPGTFACSGTAGVAPAGVSFARVSSLEPSSSAAGAAARPRLRLRHRRVLQRHSRSCVRFLVSAGGRRLRGATVRFAGHRGRSGRRGRVTICARVKAGRHPARATKGGYRAARRSVRVPARR